MDELCGTVGSSTTTTSTFCEPINVKKKAEPPPSANDKMGGMELNRIRLQARLGWREREEPGEEERGMGNDEKINRSLGCHSARSFSHPSPPSSSLHPFVGD
ncbi:unnamed protein product [Leuciscus chuanchicus]